jgi:FHA domain
MTFDAQMRIGSMEISAALLAVAVFTARPRVRSAAEIGPMVPMRVALDIIEFGQTRSFEERPPFEGGRAPENDLVLGDPEVSRRHVVFETRGGIVYVDDLHSSNGTFLNGRRVTEAIEVRENDYIDVGATRLIVRSLRPEAVA